MIRSLALTAGLTALLWSSVGAADLRPPASEARRSRGTIAQVVTLANPSGASRYGTPLRAWRDRDTTAPAVPPTRSRGWDQPPGSSETNVVYFLPRAVFYVPTLAVQMVFKPVQAAVSLLDRYAIIEVVDDFLHNADHTGGVVPTAEWQSGYGPSVGLKVFHDDLFGHGESASFRARFGGVFQQGYQFKFDASRLGGTRIWLEGRFRYESKPGLLFYGLGDPRGDEDGPRLGPRQGSVETRYRSERYLTLLRTGVTLGQPGALTKLGVTLIHNFRDLSPPDTVPEGDVPIEAVYDTSRLGGFDRVFNSVELEANLIIDTRNRNAGTSSGFAMEAFFGGALPIDGFTFWHYGAEASVYIDLYKGNRVLLLRAAVEAVEGEDDEVPFVELPRLGGANDLRGYALDRFRDQKAVVASIEYHYPIHEYVTGELFVDFGRVGKDWSDLFGEQAWSQWRVGGGGGVIISSRDSVLLRFDLAYGEGLQFFVSTDLARAFKGREKEL